MSINRDEDSGTKKIPVEIVEQTRVPPAITDPFAASDSG
jgi:hypothetical protein